MPISLEKLKILLLVPDGASRARLREVLATVVYKGEILSARSVPDAIAQLRRDPEVEVIFVAFSLGAEVVDGLLRSLKQERIAKRHAVVITVDEQNANYSAKVVQMYQSGVDGFVAEPYSSVDVQQILEKVRDPVRVQAIQAAVRVYRSVQFLAQQAAPNIDELWLNQVKGLKEGGYALKDLKGISPTLEKLYSENGEEFASAMIDVFEAVPAAKLPSGVTKKKKIVKEIKHPGVLVLEIMTARNLTTEKLLGIIRISPEDFDRIVTCNMSIDEAMARELARTLGKTAREWVSIQKKYDDQRAKQEE